MTGESLTSRSIPGIIHRAPYETVEMNKYHFLLVLTQMREQESRFRPRGEWCLIPFGIFLTSLQSLITANFKNIWLGSATWEAVAVLMAWGSAAAAAILFFWWLVDKWTRRVKTPEEVLDEVTGQMERDRERARSQTT
jgi:hypothetical protein